MTSSPSTPPVVARIRFKARSGKRQARENKTEKLKKKKKGNRKEGREKEKGTGEKTDRDSWVCRAAGCLIERGFLWARVDISVNEAFPRKPGGGHSCGEGLRHQWGCEGKAPALSIAILSSVAIKGFLTCHGGSIACFKDGRVISFYFSSLQLLPAFTRRSR